MATIAAAPATLPGPVDALKIGAGQVTVTEVHASPVEEKHDPVKAAAAATERQFEIVKVRKPDGRIVKVKRPIKPKPAPAATETPAQALSPTAVETSTKAVPTAPAVSVASPPATTPVPAQVAKPTSSPAPAVTSREVLPSPVASTPTPVAATPAPAAAAPIKKSRFSGFSLTKAVNGLDSALTNTVRSVELVDQAAIRVNTLFSNGLSGGTKKATTSTTAAAATATKAGGTAVTVAPPSATPATTATTTVRETTVPSTKSVAVHSAPQKSATSGFADNFFRKKKSTQADTTVAPRDVTSTTPVQNNCTNQSSNDGGLTGGAALGGAGVGAVAGGVAASALGDYESGDEEVPDSDDENHAGEDEDVGEWHSGDEDVDEDEVEHGAVDTTQLATASLPAAGTIENDDETIEEDDGTGEEIHDEDDEETGGEVQNDSDVEPDNDVGGGDSDDDNTN